MMKRIKPLSLKILIIVMLCFLCAGVCFTGSFFKPEAASAASVDDNYYFESVDFTASVNKNKSLTVCETLTVHFYESGINTGIIRDIQRLSKTTRIIDGKNVDGKVYIASLKNVSVTLDGGKCKVTQSLYNNNQFYSIKMQTPEGYIAAGTHAFVLNYTYGMADDRIAGYDDLTYDVLGYAMAKTEKFTATVTFPEDADLSNVTFRTNDKEVWTPDAGKGEVAEVEGNVIKITASPEMKDKGYTIQVLMPTGYFGGRTFVWYYVIFLIIALGGVAGCVVLLFKNRNKKALEPVEFYPPEDTTVMRFAAIWDKKSKLKHAGALILKWAGMGIVTVENDGNKEVIIKAQVLKGKEYAKKPASERLPKSDKKYFDTLGEETYFDTLFSGMGGRNFTFSTKYFKRNASYSQKRRLYDAAEALQNEVSKFGGSVTASTSKGKIAVVFTAAVPTLAAVLYNCVLNKTAFPLFLIVFILAGCLPLIFFNFFTAEESSVSILWIVLIFPVVFYATPYAVFLGMYNVQLYDYAYIIYWAPAVWVVGAFILPWFMNKRTAEAQATYGRIRGFRNFILKAELPRIQLLFDENPFYYADILPYCLIMGISEKVKKRFGGLQIKIPQYVEQNVNMNSLSRSIAHSSSVGAPPSYSSGGGSSSGGGGGGSGGSSGGGGGGGGSRGC